MQSRHPLFHRHSDQSWRMYFQCAALSLSETKSLYPPTLTREIFLIARRSWIVRSKNQRVNWAAYLKLYRTTFSNSIFGSVTMACLIFKTANNALNSTSVSLAFLQDHRNPAEFWSLMLRTCQCIPNWYLTATNRLLLPWHRLSIVKPTQKGRNASSL